MKKFVQAFTTFIVATGLVIWALANAIGNTLELRATDEIVPSLSIYATLFLSAIVPVGIAIFLVMGILRILQKHNDKP